MSLLLRHWSFLVTCGKWCVLIGRYAISAARRVRHLGYVARPWLAVIGSLELRTSLENGEKDDP